MRSPDTWGEGNLRVVLRDTILILILILPAIWSIPFISHLLALGSLTAPLPIAMLVALAVALAGATFQIHNVLERMFSQTFLGTDDPFSFDDPEHRYSEEDSYVYTDDGSEPVYTGDETGPYDAQESEAVPPATEERVGD
jgi:hypothetical protein